MRMRLSDRKFKIAGWIVGAVLGLIAALAAFFIQQHYRQIEAVSNAAHNLKRDAENFESHLDKIWADELTKEIASFHGCDFLRALESFHPPDTFSIDNNQQGISACAKITEVEPKLLPPPLRSCPRGEPLSDKQQATIEEALESAAGYFNKDDIKLIPNTRLVEVINLTKSQFVIQLKISMRYNEIKERFCQAVLLCQINQGIALFREILGCIKSGLATIETGDDYEWPASCQMTVERRSAFRSGAPDSPCIK